MLSKLNVSNFVLIENEELIFHHGFTVITGETGSGKSILLGALKLILGDRADFTVIRDKSKKTIVEGSFELSKDYFYSFFTDHDLDFADETIIRREINANGKSRAFINDTPVQLTILKLLTQQLIHIHSQHNTIQLKDRSFQLNMLDAYASISNEQDQLGVVYKSYKSLEHKLQAKKTAYAELSKEFDFLNFQLQELQQLALEETNYLDLEEKLKAIEQSEDITQAFSAIHYVIEESDESVIGQLKTLMKSIQFDFSQLNELNQRIESTIIELNDISAEAQIKGSSLSLPEDDLDDLTAKIDAYNHALRKHHVVDQQELRKVCQDIKSQLDLFENSDDEIKALEKEKENLWQEAQSLAKTISQSRKKAAVLFEDDLKHVLSELKLNDAILKFDFSEKDLNEKGIDDIHILFSPNKGLAPRPIEKSASGGELSRLMLAIHYLLSKKQNLPTVIFDEIDTGVSGEVASKIGGHLKKMGENMQLMAITHLPQVAAMGSEHFVVEKYNESSITKTAIRLLENDERTIEVARLMSGEEINDAAKQNALNLLNS
jgi:DNA repair protein RecN (Recombination protein N)